MTEARMCCDLCGGTPDRTVAINDGYQAGLCLECDFMSTVVPDAGERDAATVDLYSLENRISFYYDRKKEFVKRYERIYRLIASRKPGGRLRTMLEIGSNIGFFCKFVRAKGVAVDAVEVVPSLRNFQKAVYGINALESLESLEDGKKFDLVVLMDALEHIPGPLSFLTKASDWLNEEGVIFLQFPNKNSLSARLAGKRWRWWSAPDHLYHFSERAVRRIAEKAGLEVQYLGKTTPILDDLVNLPFVGRLFSPLFDVNRRLPLNHLVDFGMGSLLQVILKKRNPIHP